MQKRTLKEKLTSRKFLLTLVSVIAGIAGLITGSDGVAEYITEVGLIVVPTIVFVAAEGKIDAASVRKITETISEVTRIEKENDAK